MRIYISHSKDIDFVTELYDSIRKSNIYKKNKVFLPYLNKYKPISTKDIIKSADLFIAEVSQPSTGQGIELGWANLFNIPIICIYKKNNGPSSRSLKFLTKDFIVYRNFEDLIKKLLLVINK